MPTSVLAARTLRPSRGLVTVTHLVAVPAALAVSGLVIAQSSYSAYSSTLARPETSWASGTVSLTDDDTDVAAFQVANARPGSSGSRCLVVTSQGTLSSQVRVHAAPGTGSTDLAAYLDLVITQGTGGSFGSCDGFTPLAGDAEVFHGSLMAFGRAHTGYANGIGGWSPAGSTPESRTYRFAWALSPDAPGTTMGGTAGGAIVFEVQS